MDQYEGDKDQSPQRFQDRILLFRSSSCFMIKRAEKDDQQDLGKLGRLKIGKTKVDHRRAPFTTSPIPGISTRTSIPTDRKYRIQ